MAASKTIVTDIGKAKIAQAAATGTTVKLKYFAVGDGAGSEYTPTGKEDRLLGENWRSNIDSIVVNKTDPKELLIDTVVPENVGGWWVREYGVFDEDNSLILIGTINQVYKSKLEEGDIIAFDFNLSVILQNVSNVEYVIDLASYVSFDFLLNANYEVTGQVDHRNRLKITSASGDNRVAIIQDILNLYKINISVQPATEILGTSLRANGTLDALGISTNIVQTGFEYRLTGSQTWQRSSLSDMTATGNFTAVISGLIKNTTYDLRAIGINKQHSGNIGYSEIINVTTANLNPQVDSVINITGTTDSSSNSALTTVTVPEISNGHVVAGAAIADADNCISQTLEISQAADKSDLIAIQPTFALNPRKLNILPETTKDSIVLSSPLAGLLSNNSRLWVDDGGTMKDVTVANVVESTFDNSAAPWNTASTNTTPMGNWSAMAYGNGVIIICGASSTNTFVIARSFDNGTTWSSYNLSISVDGRPGLCYANGKWILAVGYDVKYSLDNGTTWINATITLSGGTFGTVCYGNGKFILIPKLGGNVYSSADGITWTVIGTIPAIDSGKNYHYLGLIYANGKFLVCGSGTVHSSSDGVVWTPHYIGSVLSGIAYGAGLYVTISQSAIKSSSDLVTWTDREATPGGRPGGITFANGVFAGVACEGDFPYISVRTFTSIDGLSWARTTQPSLVAGFANLIVYTGSLFFVCSGVTVFDAGVPNQQSSALAYTSTAGAIPQYTCTGLSPALTNAPTAVYKSGQKFATSVSKTAGVSNYVVTATDSVVRVDDTLIMSMKQQNAAGRYTRLQATINNGDQMVRYTADLYINQTTPRSDGHYLPCGYEVLKPNEHLGYSDDDIADFENRHKQEQQASLAEIARERLNESQLYAHDHSLTQAQKEELAEYNGSLILIIRGELDSLPAEPIWFYL